jgi:hypothetical protein
MGHPCVSSSKSRPRNILAYFARDPGTLGPGTDSKFIPGTHGPGTNSDSIPGTHGPGIGQPCKVAGVRHPWHARSGHRCPRRLGQTFGAALRPDKVISPASRAVLVLLLLLLLSSSDVIDTRLGQTFGAALRPDKVISPAQRVARRSCVSYSSSCAPFLCLLLLLRRCTYHAFYQDVCLTNRKG